MDCDRVFMVLTRGPFPSGDPVDAQVEDHLEGCPDCWRLAEALRPATDVFQEAIPAAESRSLPGYWGAAAPPQDYLARVTEQTAVAQRVRPARPVASRVALQRTAQWRDALEVLAILVGVLGITGAAGWLLLNWAT